VAVLLVPLSVGKERKPITPGVGVTLLASYIIHAALMVTIGVNQ